MDRQLIKTLIDALQASALAELEYSRAGETLRLAKAATIGAATRPAPPATRPATQQDPAAPAPAAQPPAAPSATVDAPLFGTVHLRPAPGAPPFVSPGQAVEAGQVVCKVEAMKVFMDVRTDRAGTVAAVLVADLQEVEPGQALVRLG